MERKVLLLGAGSSRDIRAMTPLGNVTPAITTLDIEPRHGCDVQWDLNILDWPFGDNEFEEVHAYEVLEHLGQQGDAKSFFAHFGEIYRILKPNGILAGSVPCWDSIWAFGDPSHRRVINIGSFTFLDQTQYAEQVGKTAMTDFRSIWKGDFEVQTTQKVGDQLYFMLKAYKPARAVPVAQFTREGAKIQEVYVRRELAGGQQKYLRLPFNLIEYDDASGVYVEPIPTTGMIPWTFGDVNNAATDAEFLILDKPPFDGVTEIK